MARRRKEKNVYWGAFVLGWFEHLQDNELTSSDYKILFFLCQKMNINDNKVYLKQKQIAEDLSMDKGNVSKCIKKLCEKQFVVKSANGYMINPHLFYVGKRNTIDRDELRDDFDELLDEIGLKPRFSLNEDEYTLELVSDHQLNNRIQDEDYPDDSPF
ncbi:MarR family transcriptional regulator [Peribacillus frigoritolerans]|uniref:MarR family transcriptional regulator n=1 Tax=Peribacillus frigoritolerans TaxID=450367 RepID=UPI001F4F7104|nr:helix-turn-helix domain-containing protein [Peribacillus frigoritolerans]MCK2021259.1 MarR family transcriptional regulator [Peribacillus frigoritolerans]